MDKTFFTHKKGFKTSAATVLLQKHKLSTVATVRKFLEKTVFLALFIAIAIPFEQRYSFEPQNKDSVTQISPFVLSLLNKLNPKPKFTKNDDVIAVADSKEPKPFTLNTERTVEVKGKTEVLSFLKSLMGRSVTHEATDLHSKLAAAKVPTMLRPGTKASLKLDQEGELISATWRADENNFVQLDRFLDDALSIRKIPDTHQTQERVIRGTIYSSFIEAAATAGLPLSLVDDFVDLFGDRVDFRKDLQPGDTFAIILDQKQGSDGTWLSTGTIKAACLMNNGKLKAVVRYQNASGQWINYDEAGQPIGSFFLKYPVQFTRVSSVFTDARLHPVLGIVRPHNGVDFAAPIGTPVRAVGEGTIELAGYSGGSGNMVKLSHNSRYSTAYLHLSKIASGVKKGVKVVRGQIIGYVGMTGLATGPHLHFSLYDRGHYIDPIKSKLGNILPDKNKAPLQYVQANIARLKSEINKPVMAHNSSQLDRG